MTVEHAQRPQTSITRPSGLNLVPYAENNNSRPSGWTVPTGNGWESPPHGRNASPPYARSPPRSPLLPEVYGGIAAGRSGGGGGGLPVGAPPLTPEEKRSYVPYQ
ncbi:hypothetical protein FRC06_010335 [Ceratobasidium sp. 370]|nr:hypothetical protein FRC06_010335 [Ceratobasidium sp. 370]